MNFEIPLNVESVLDAYLHTTPTVVKTLGGKSTKPVSALANDDLLIQRLQSRNKFIDGISMTTVILLIVVIVFLGCIIWLNHTNQSFVCILLTGQGGSIFGGVKALNKLKKEEVYNILILSQFQQADQNERKKIIENYYKYLNA
jgi:hypothetical protein